MKLTVKRSLWLGVFCLVVFAGIFPYKPDGKRAKENLKKRYYEQMASNHLVIPATTNAFHFKTVDTPGFYYEVDVYSSDTNIARYKINRPGVWFSYKGQVSLEQWQSEKPKSAGGGAATGQKILTADPH
jgi:hypothetical protein